MVVVVVMEGRQAGGRSQFRSDQMQDGKTANTHIPVSPSRGKGQVEYEGLRICVCIR